MSEVVSFEIWNTVTLNTALFLTAVFILAGLIKGLSGFGMPLVAIPVVTLFANVPVTKAMGWTIASILATNLVQVVILYRRLFVIARLWPLFVGLFTSMLLSVQLLTYLDPKHLSLMVGITILVVVTAQLMRPWHVQEHWQTAYLGASGIISGTIGGLTSFFGFPALQSMLSINLLKEEFIFAVSLMFFIGGLIIGSALATQDLMTADDVAISIHCLLPSLVGMIIGQRARNKFSTALFKKVVLAVLLITGVSMVLRSLL